MDSDDPAPLDSQQTEYDSQGTEDDEKQRVAEEVGGNPEEKEKCNGR
jgi:hypothetical protein